MSRQEAEWWVRVLGRLLSRNDLVLAGNVVDLVYLYSRAVREKHRHMFGG